MAGSLAAEDPAEATALLEELAASGEGQVADQARAELATREKLKSPLDLHFTAVDGSDVDLSKMRGKVVLIDFWATWCGPCRAELPNVVAAYKKLHDKGFEVVGISLDQDKRASAIHRRQWHDMAAVLRRQGLGEQNQFRIRHRNPSPPCGW